MSQSDFREAMKSRIIDPEEMIKEAESRAKQATTAAKASQKNEKQAGVSELDTEDSLDKQADSTVTAIDEYLSGTKKESSSEPGTPIEKQGANSSQQTADTSKTTTSEKAAEKELTSPKAKTAANLIRAGIISDAAEEEVATEKLAQVDLETVDWDVLNEKVAVNVSNILKNVGRAVTSKPAIGVGALGAGGAGGAVIGHRVGAEQERDKARKILQADEISDQKNLQRAVRYGQLSMLKRIREAQRAQGAAEEGGANG